MKLIAGLGNPGEKYEKTRHNLGFMVVEKFFKDFESVHNMVWSDDKKLKSSLVIIDYQPKTGKAEKVILVKPKTYMNNSGMAVQLISSFYKIESQDIWVIHDDLDLPLGRMKMRLGGAGAGHHGIEDIMEKLGTDKFWRFRLGIGGSKNISSDLDDDGKEKMISRRYLGDASDFVLGEFSGKETGEVKKLIRNGSEALRVALEKGIDSAMNRFNTK